jgi:hypothetical protein
LQTSVLETVRPTFRAVAHVVVPETRSLSAAEWTALEAAVERALAGRPPEVRKQLAAFLRLIEYLPIPRYGARLSNLRDDRATTVLRWLERSKVLLIRRGVWGLRTLVMLGYYTQPEVQHAIGYRAHPDGWNRRRRSGEYPVVTGHNAAS